MAQLDSFSALFWGVGEFARFYVICTLRGLVCIAYFWIRSSPRPAQPLIRPRFSCLLVATGRLWRFCPFSRLLLFVVVSVIVDRIR